jgi:hypothetical protein
MPIANFAFPIFAVVGQRMQKDLILSLERKGAYALPSPGKSGSRNVARAAKRPLPISPSSGPIPPNYAIVRKDAGSSSGHPETAPPMDKMMDNRPLTRKRNILLVIAASFSILIVAENVPHAANSLLTIFSSPPEPQTSLVVGAYVFLPLIVLWASWAFFRKGKHSLVSFPIAACAIFLTMDFLLPYPGPIKKAVLIIDEGRKIYEVGLEHSSDESFLTKQGNPIGISLNYTMSMPAGGKYLIQTHLSPNSHPLTPEDAGIDQTGSALEVMTGPDEWTVSSKMNVRRAANAIPRFIMYDAAKNGFCLSPLAKDLMKDNPGLVNYRVEIRVGGKQTFLDQIAILHFETQHSYDVRAFYESAVKEQMPLCPL